MRQFDEEFSLSKWIVTAVLGTIVFFTAVHFLVLYITQR